MSAQQWIELARVLVWPVALVALAVVFRRPLSRLLVTITQLRFRDLEIDFGRELEKLRGTLPSEVPEAAKAEVEAAQALGQGSAGLATEAASAQPLAGVLLAWKALEGRLKERAGAGPPVALPPELENLVQGLAELSRAAAGGRLKSGSLSPGQARAYIHLAARAAAWLDSLA
jgi:hypothetical protein